MAILCKGARVTVSYGAVSGTSTEDTDEDGWATFRVVENEFSSGNTSVSHVFINGEEVGDSFTPMMEIRFLSHNHSCNRLPTNRLSRRCT
jgi:hypothetical protein